MTMHTPPENQGQIVEVSYGWSVSIPGTLYKRVHDRSDRSTQWYVASNDDEVADYQESSSGLWDAAPPIATWTPCDEPTDE